MLNNARDRQTRTLGFVAVIVCVTFLVLPAAAGAITAAGKRQLAALPKRPSATFSTTRPYWACPPSSVKPGGLECDGVGVPTAFIRRVARALHGEHNGKIEPLGHGVSGSGYSPADIQKAYNLPSSTQGSGQTIAVIVAHNNPYLEQNLTTYRSTYGLPACTTTNGCFRKVNWEGIEGNYPSEPNGSSWGLEAAADVELVSAACPNCHILLVEIPDSVAGVGAGVNTAARLGASVISASWGTRETKEYAPEMASLESSLNHPGILMAAASGDSGNATPYTEWPAASPYVLSVGGTTLTEAANSRGFTESTWSLSGGGCSFYVAKPSWETTSLCGQERSANDISADADWTYSPVSVYSTYNSQGEADQEHAWQGFGGTSAATPIIAGTYALADNYTRSFGGSAVWKFAQEGGALNDITTGSNGACTEYYVCHAGPGYDGPTGWGTPWGAPVVKPPPTVSTDAPQQVGERAMVLSGHVNPNGLDTHYYFEYGQTASYGSRIPSPPGTDLGAGTGSVAVSSAVSGLLPATKYHYRVVAVSSGGTSVGEDHTWTTHQTISTFEANTNNLFTYSSATDVSRDTKQGMMGGTQPSIALSSSGTYYVAFQANTSNLAIYSSATGVSTVTPSGMMAGSHPSIAMLAEGGYEVAFETNTTNLALYSSATGQTTVTNLGMANGTSPSIAALSNGAYDVAFEANTNTLFVYSSLTGSASETKQGMAAHTNPSILALSSSRYDVAFQANTTNLAIYSSAIGVSQVTNLGMAAGASPSIASLGGEGYEVALEANTYNLITYSSTGVGIDTKQGMATGTDPSIVEMPIEGCKIAFQTNTDVLGIYSCASGVTHLTPSGMAAGTGPSIALG